MFYRIILVLYSVKTLHQLQYVSEDQLVDVQREQEVEMRELGVIDDVEVHDVGQDLGQVSHVGHGRQAVAVSRVEGGWNRDLFIRREGHYA